MKTVTHLGMEGTGRTITEAKQDAREKIERAMEGEYTPEILSWRGWSALVWREPVGWCYRLIVCPGESIREGRVYGATNHETRKEAAQAARAHMADLGWLPEDGIEAPSFLDKEYAAEYRTKAHERGLSDVDAHAYAGQDPTRPELWRDES